MKLYLSLGSQQVYNIFDDSAGSPIMLISQTDDPVLEFKQYLAGLPSEAEKIKLTKDIKNQRVVVCKWDIW